jgi:hypothetical protein
MVMAFRTMRVVGDGLGGGEHEPSGFNSLGADQSIRQLADLLRGASEEDDFEAAVGVEMDVGGRHHPADVEMLKLGEPIADSTGVVVVDQGDDAHRVALIVGDDFFNERRAHQAADGFTSVGITMGFSIVVEFLEQIAPDRDTEPNEGIPGLFHLNSGPG